MPRLTANRGFRFFAVVVVLSTFVLAGILLGRVHESSGPKGQARRIVSMAPSLTEILFAVGAGNQVVGVSSYTEYPKEATELPALGGQLDPDLEALAGLRPDLVLTLGHHDRIATHAEELQVELREVPMDTLEQVGEAISIVGEVTGHVEEAAELRAEIDRQLGELAQAADRQRGERPRPRVLLVVGREPGRVRGVFAAGPGSYLSDALHLAGGENAVRDRRPWPELSSEDIVRTDPDLVIELQAEAEAGAPALWSSTFPTLRASRANAIEVLTGRSLVIPGPRVVDLVARLAKVIAAH